MLKKKKKRTGRNESIKRSRDGRSVLRLLQKMVRAWLESGSTSREDKM